MEAFSFVCASVWLRVVDETVEPASLTSSRTSPPRTWADAGPDAGPETGALDRRMYFMMASYEVSFPSTCRKREEARREVWIAARGAGGGIVLVGGSMPTNDRSEPGDVLAEGMVDSPEDDMVGTCTPGHGLVTNSTTRPAVVCTSHPTTQAPGRGSPMTALNACERTRRE